MADRPDPRYPNSGHRYGGPDWPIRTDYGADLGYGAPTHVGPEARVSWVSISSEQYDALSGEFRL